MVGDPHDHPAPHLWFTTLLGLIPWCIFPVLALFRLRLGTILVHAKNWWRESDDFTKFNVIGVLFTLVLFSIPTSKRAVYILPAFPSIAFLISGLILKGGIPGSSVVCIIVSWASKIVSVFTLGASLTLLCGGLGVIPSGAPDGYFGRLSASALSGFSDPVWWGEVVVVCIFAGWCVFNLKGFGQYYREVATPEIRAGVTFLIAVALVNTFLMTIIAPALSVEDWIRSKDFQEKVKLSSYSKAYSFGSESYESSFYTGLPFERILPERCQREGLVFLEKRHQEKLRETCGVLVTPITQFQPFDGKPSRALVVGTLSAAK